MASDYEAISQKNEKLYGTDIGRYGKSLLTGLYDDRTHFIYELLQNAEDALGRHKDKPQSRTVRFDLFEDMLRIGHYGKPFDRSDVEGVCGIALGTKAEDVTQIGRFGIGFKSVYGFTDRPEIHSGDEDFVIKSFVWPAAASTVERQADETVILMPLRDPNTDSPVIANGLGAIRPNTLLFLREIDTIEWNSSDGESGIYFRQQELLDDHVRKVTVIGESANQPEKESTWFVFSIPMHDNEKKPAGYVEVAFSMEDDKIVRVPRSPLVVFFPTAVETELGFRAQGPYRTTPSRDNVPKGDAWNKECVKKTGKLLVKALLWLRKNEMLDTNVLQCLLSRPIQV